MKTSRYSLVALTSLFLSVLTVSAADNPQTVTVKAPLQIPGSQLKPGSYNFSVEDRLADRAIVRISNTQDPAEHYFVLAVPDSKVSVNSGDHLAYFKGANNVEPVRAWQCGDCSVPLEFVYPKAEAAKLTDDNAETVMAVDPSYDKLPSNLNQDDMKVVTLWLLSPKQINANNLGEGVKAAKYAAPSLAPSVSTASSSAPTLPPPSPNAAAAQTATSADSAVTTVAAADVVQIHGRKHLPKTASNTYLYALAGILLLSVAIATRLFRTRRA